jgi:cellulose synthase operon protein C
LELIDRHLPWLATARDPDSEMSFASFAARQLRRLVEIGHGSAPLHEATVGEQEERLRQRALNLAAQFAARNGNSSQSDLIRARMSAQPISTQITGA